MDDRETLDGVTGNVIQKKVMPWTAMLDVDADAEADEDEAAASSSSCLNRLLHNGVVLHVVVEHLDGVPVDQALQDVLLKVLFVSCGGRSGGIGDRTPFEASEKHMVDVKRVDVVSDLQIYG